MGNRGALPNAQWNRLVLLVESLRRRGPRGGSDRLFVEEVIWVVRTGTPWRDFPTSFGTWSTVYQRFRRLAVAGRWDALLRLLAVHDDAPEMLLIDSTIVKAHPNTAGARAWGRSFLHEPIGRCRASTETLMHRNVIERFFGRVKAFRRVATRYGKAAASYAALLVLASSVLEISEWTP